MANGNFSRTGLALLALCAALPALADTQFRVRRSTRDDIPIGKGQCDINLQVDGEVEVTVRRDTVFIRTISGRDAYDDGGSECNAPLPAGQVEAFNFQVSERRNDITLLSEPTRRTNYGAVIRIRDSSGGQGRYRFRLTWQMTGNDNFDRRGDDRRGDDRRGERNLPPNSNGRGRGVGRQDENRFPDFPPDDRRGGFSWNNTIHFNGRGRGSSALAGRGAQRLSNAVVDIDRGGKIIVRFQTDSGRPLVLNGTVTGREGSRYRADVMSEDRRLRGPMYITINRDEVDSIRLDATDGRDRMNLTWDHR
jgi:hypothetical protein